MSSHPHCRGLLYRTRYRRRARNFERDDGDFGDRRGSRHGRTLSGDHRRIVKATPLSCSPVSQAYATRHSPAPWSV